MPVVPLARGKQGSPNDAITPEERNRIAASLRGNEQAPTSREQTAASINWRQIFDQLGNPFSNERLSVSRLKLMRRDPIIGFGLSFIRTPLMKADWYIKCSDAAIAGFIDEALRDIYPSLVIQITQSLDFGFQAIAKRFELRTPDGTYIDPADATQTEKPVWQQGTVQPLMWKTFVPLEPETVQPIFDDNTGEFAGINWKPTNANAVPKRTGMKTAESGSFDIDLYHSLWATNERESVGGNIYGYPRLGYAYQYWWSYWFRWAIADRAFEKKADPSIIVRHPEGQFVDEQTGSTMSFRDYALLMGDRLRSGSTVALPSEPYLGFEDRPSNTPQWDISFLTDGFDFNPFDESFTYLDTAKLRALWIPEQALIEGRGGTSSRNVASTFGDAFADSQEVLMKTVDEIINRYIVPQLVITNFPEFVGSCKKITKGFTSDDVAFQKQLIQLIGQQESGQAEMAKLVDMQELLKDAKVPLRSFQAQQLYEQQQQELAQQQQPTEIAPVPGQAAGVTPNPGSALGFSYVQPPEMIVLSDTQTEFASTLAQLPHFQDSVVRTHARGLWGVWKKQYGNAYASFVDYLETLEQIELADDEDQGSVFDWEFSASRSARKAALKLIDAWEGATTDLPDTITRTTDLVRRTIKRASLVARRQHLLPSAPSQDTINDYASQHASDIVTSAMQTTRDELVTFVANQIDSGITDAKQLARAVNEHFGDFPKWKADRLARTAITEAINAANLLTMEASGVEQAQAIDGADDPECSKRNGRLYPIRDALNVRDHPNGTLAWRPGFSLTDIHYAPAEEFETGARGEYDFDSQVITFSDAISDAEQGQFLLELGDYLRDSGS